MLGRNVVQPVTFSRDKLLAVGAAFPDLSLSKVSRDLIPLTTNDSEA